MVEEGGGLTLIGKRIGERYELLQVIGEGGMSRVYLARDVILDREVAIKILHYDFANEEDLKKRFQREALSATSLSHPNIVDIYDVGEDGEIHYLVMEYIKGQTLKTYIQQRGHLTAYEAVPIMQQLVSAISHAHHNGIIHRDVKPQNILMDASGNVKITDFGIAMALDATAYTKTNSIIGTVHYLSPEQARGGMATKRSDIYSLGIVFYELLTGELPFAAETAVAIALKHLQEEIPSVRSHYPEVPQSVENIILKATTKSPDHRYQSADEMYEDLQTALNTNRLNEAKYFIPYDDDATKVMPAIKDLPKMEAADTIIQPTPRIEAQLEEQQPTPPPAKKSKKKWWIGGAIVLLLLVATLPFFFGSKKATVPEVVGEEEKEAIEIIEAAGFVVEESIEEPSDEVEEGIVIRTIPDGGVQREKGSKITIYVSSGHERMKFANYVGRSIDDVKKLLADFDFDIQVEEEFNEAEPGTIIKQNIEAGEEIVPKETTVIFTVSKGIEMKKVDKLIGMSESDLTAYAKSSGFDIRIVREEFSSEQEKGKVISQQPSAGSELKRGGQVNVVVSKGPPSKPVKLIVQSVTIPYEEEVVEDGEDGEKQPQSIRIYVQDRKHSMTDPIETFDITETTKRRITIELEEGQRGGYRIMRGATVIEEEMFDYKDVE